MNLSTWLLAMVQPVLARALGALSLGVVSIVGVEAGLNQIKTMLVDNMHAMPAEWLQFALYLWIGKGLGIIFGACSAKLALWSIQNATSILGKTAG